MFSCVYVFLAWAFGVWYACRGQGTMYKDLWESVHSFHQVGPGDQIQVVRLGYRYFYPLSISPSVH